jgi:hypothetical protein
LLAALGSLPALLTGLRENDLNDTSLIYKAKQFKARISKFDSTLEQELEDPLLVCEKPASPTSCMPTYYDFVILKVGFRYCLYWNVAIIANTILMGLGERDASLSE